MRALRRLILAAGLATLAYLLWRFDAGQVWAAVSKVGWGFSAVLALQLLDQALNAVGWRFAFAPEDARRAPFWKLVAARMAGDGVNYLTPSGSIAGELIRPSVLGDCLPEAARNASVVAAKFAQAAAQALFILLGLIFVVQGRLDFLKGAQRAAGLVVALGTISLVAAAFAVLARKPRPGEWRWLSDPRVAAVRALMRGYLERHPGRLALSVAFFVLGYAVGTLEVVLVCRLMGAPMPLATALTVEVLSNAVDSILFMVPAKMGTQEGGKVLIFHGLGYAPGLGLAFGIVRHARELAWAGTGFAIYAFSKPAPAPRARPEGPLPTPSEPVGLAD